MDDASAELFYEVHRGLPRQGPGDNQSTARALALCSALPDKPAVLDLGCGPGMQTLALAQACSGNIIAVDSCEEYLDQLRQRLENSPVSDRVEVRRADMTVLDFPQQ